MLPLTLLGPTRLADILNADAAYAKAILTAAEVNQLAVPGIEASQILLSSAAPDLSDLVNQSSYPRICLYSGGFRNDHLEKFRSLSGSLAVIAEIWTSGNFVNDTDRWIHFYVDAFTTLVGNNIGDWGDGLYFPGPFEIQFQQPKRGGFGFTQMAKITCTLAVSR